MAVTKMKSSTRFPRCRHGSGELISDMEKKFNVTRLRRGGGLPAGGGRAVRRTGGGSTARVPQDDERVRPPTKSGRHQVFARSRDWGLKEAKEGWLKELLRPFQESIPKADAETIKKKLEDAGRQGCYPSSDYCRYAQFDGCPLILAAAVGLRFFFRRFRAESTGSRRPRYCSGATRPDSTGEAARRRRFRYLGAVTAPGKA